MPGTPRRIGFVVNPIAGMGGRVALKGTDGVVEEARARGAVPVAPGKAIDFVASLARLGPLPPVAWLTARGAMGSDALAYLRGASVEVVREQGAATSAEDTRAAVRAFVERGAELVVFCGGDGTARDVVSVTGTAVPVLGIPSGVKMYSGVFGIHPMSAAQALASWLRSEAGEVEAEVLDLDEDAFRSDRIAVRLHAAAKTLGEPTYVQAGKMSFERVEDDEVRDEVAATVAMEVRRQKEAVWVLGSGSTVEAIGRRLGVAKTVLGVDVLVDGRLAAKDAGEAGLLRILDEHKERPRRLVVTPIGAQGFILGRGNLQLSPAVVRAIGIENVTVVATPAKLARTPALRVDTGDPELDRAFATKGYLPVVVAFNTTRLVKVEG